MAIDENIPQFTATPLRTNPATFSADTDTYHTELAAFIISCNQWSTEANATQADINAKSANVDAKNANVNTQAQIATDKANEAEASAQRAENAVPIGDSYNQTAIDAKNATQNQAIYTSSGYIDSHKKEDLFGETIIPNTLQLKKDVDVVINGKLGTIASGTQITMPLRPFDPASNDDWYDSGITQTSVTYYKTDMIIQEDGDLIWQFLKEIPNGTPFASLVENTDYQVLDEATRQDIFYIAKSTNGTPQYKSIKGLKYYLDKDILNHDLIASDLGWSKLGNNLYTDGTDEITEITIVPRLNAGAFDFSTNFFGDKEYSDGAYKDSAFRDISVYSSFANKGTINGRPDLKDSEQIYLNGENGIIYKPSGAKEIHESALVQEWQRDCISDLSGINSQNDNSYFTTQGTALVVEDLTDTAKVLWDLSSKALEVKQVLYTTDNGATWNTETFTLDPINNQITLGNARAEIKVSYAAQNQTLQQQEPIEILAFGNQAIASNSYSFYKSSMLGLSATGEIQTGNASESRSIEMGNAKNWNWTTLTGDGNIIATGDVFLNVPLSTHPSQQGKLEGLYKRTGNSFPASGTGYDFGNKTNWEYLGYMVSFITPSSNQINLDNSNSSAFKGLPFVGKASNNELVVGMFTEEGKYNASGYGWNSGVGLTFQQLSNGLVDGVYENDLQTKILYKRTGRFKND